MPPTTPAMWGFQAAGAAPLVAGHPIDDPETIATAIRIGNPASWDLATDARDASGGRIAAVTDDEILDAYRRARPARGRVLRAVVGGVRGGRDEGGRAGELDPDALVVCVLTGNGLKDPTTAEQGIELDVAEAEPTVLGVARALGWGLG